MDSDDSGGLSYAELKKGLRKLKLRPPIHFAGCTPSLPPSLPPRLPFPDLRSFVLATLMM